MGYKTGPGLDQLSFKGAWRAVFPVSRAPMARRWVSRVNLTSPRSDQSLGRVSYTNRLSAVVPDTAGQPSLDE